MGHPETTEPTSWATVEVEPPVSSRRARRLEKELSRLGPPPDSTSLQLTSARGRFCPNFLNSGRALEETAPFSQRFVVTNTTVDALRSALVHAISIDGFEVVFTPPPTRKDTTGSFRSLAGTMVAERGVLADHLQTSARDRLRFAAIATGMVVGGVGWYEFDTAPPHTLEIGLGTLAAVVGPVLAVVSALSLTDADFWSDVVIIRYSIPGRGDPSEPKGARPGQRLL